MIQFAYVRGVVAAHAHNLADDGKRSQQFGAFQRKRFGDRSTRAGSGNTICSGTPALADLHLRAAQFADDKVLAVAGLHKAKARSFHSKKAAEFHRTSEGTVSSAGADCAL